MTSPALIALADLPSVCPEWPLSPWSTAQLIRDGSLGCVQIGRRKYVTRELLAEYIAANTVPAEAARG
jgi:hypothetical protein